MLCYFCQQKPSTVFGRCTQCYDLWQIDMRPIINEGLLKKTTYCLPLQQYQRLKSLVKKPSLWRWIVQDWLQHFPCGMSSEVRSLDDAFHEINGFIAESFRQSSGISNQSVYVCVFDEAIPKHITVHNTIILCYASLKRRWH